LIISCSAAIPTGPAENKNSLHPQGTKALFRGTTLIYRKLIPNLFMPVTGAPVGPTAISVHCSQVNSSASHLATLAVYDVASLKVR